MVAIGEGWNFSKIAYRTLTQSRQSADPRSPRHHVPPIKNGRNENLVRLDVCTYWLASLPENKVFHAELEFLYVRQIFNRKTHLQFVEQVLYSPRFRPTTVLDAYLPRDREAGEWETPAP